MTKKKHDPSKGSSRLSRDSQKGISLNDRLGLIGLIDEGFRQGSSDSPIVADLFSNLWDLVSATASGSKINRLKPKDTPNGFSIFEINAASGENLGRLNMLYLKKPIPCYYLVYVEVAAPFRRKGLGTRILTHFRDFLIKKSAVGVLDNIIPEDDPTFNIYQKQAWEPIESVVGSHISDSESNYMIFIPPGLRHQNLREPVLKLIHHLKRKGAAIHMRDNEMMVKRTIDEFKGLYTALLTYFEKEIDHGSPTPPMCFMFTRFVTKLIAFRRRIGDLVGYTGGDSLEQLVLHREVAGLPMQSYAPKDLESEPSFVTGDTALWLRIPQDLKQHPARFIESLPNYRRPSLQAWLKERDMTANDPLTIGDLMDLGFDPTRLKEINLNGENFIFERIQARQLPELERRKTFLEALAPKLIGMRIRNTQLKTNPPLLVIRDRGNAYVLRRKVEGIHWEEAVEQLQSAHHLKGMNSSMKVDRMVLSTVKKTNETLAQHADPDESLLDQMTCFVSWDLRLNQPRLVVDFAATFLESVWLA
jgi:hypothetical protein